MAKRRKSGERFVALHHWLLRSAAWRTLSPNAKAVLIDIWLRHNGSNNGQIVYAVREAAGIGIGKSQAAITLSELVDRGFLKITRDSAFRVKTKEAREFAITAEPIGDTPATKDFMRWMPPERIRTRSGPPDTQSGIPDRGAKEGAKRGVSVRPAGPSQAKTVTSQSGRPDTSNLPGGNLPPDAPTASSIRSRKPPRFGDRAKAERIARDPEWIDDAERRVREEEDSRFPNGGRQ